ncbi:MAG: hypothetical protein ACFFDK_03625 [Promethearchaeota archaeon]
MLTIIKDTQKVININSNLILRSKNLVQSVVSILKYNSLLKKRGLLEKEKKLSESKQISSELTAKKDLLTKLNESLINNKKKFNYTKEDFLYLNNKRTQILNTINNYKEKIRELNKKKKDCFNEINKITRYMSDPTQKSKLEELNLDLSDNKYNSKAGAIKSLQKQAKEHQYEINQLNVKIHETQLNLDQINPSFQTIEADYNSLIKMIENDEAGINKIKTELKNELSRNEDFKEFEISAYNSFKSKQEIENEITEVSNQLKSIIGKTTYIDPDQPENLSKIIKEFTEINESLLKEDTKDLSIPYEKDEIIDCLENFRKVEYLYGDLEELLNIFLDQINLEVKFQTAISEDFNNFFIKTSFLRSTKENISFEEFTTPEKIYFVLIFSLSIKIILQTRYIIFSNLYLPSEYNRRGSIYRTISKILPIFEQEKSLKNFNLIFLISNLEMKKKIENIKVINIEEN